MIDTLEQDTFVLLDYFSHTERLLIRGNMFHWSKFLSQSVYLSGVLVYFSQTNFHLVGGLKFSQLRC